MDEVRSSQADHHEAALLELVVDVTTLLLRCLRLSSGWEDAPVQEDLDVRHARENSFEIAE
jgi:hypothetical protein